MRKLGYTNAPRQNDLQQGTDAATGELCAAYPSEYPIRFSAA